MKGHANRSKLVTPSLKTIFGASLQEKLMVQRAGFEPANQEVECRFMSEKVVAKFGKKIKANMTMFVRGVQRLKAK